MEFSENFFMHLVAAFAIGYGIYSFVKGEVTYGPEDGRAVDDRTLSGKKAKLVAALLVVSGIVMLFHMVVGLCMVVGVMFLPVLIAR